LRSSASMSSNPDLVLQTLRAKQFWAVRELSPSRRLPLIGFLTRAFPADRGLNWAGSARPYGSGVVLGTLTQGFLFASFRVHAGLFSGSPCGRDFEVCGVAARGCAERRNATAGPRHGGQAFGFARDDNLNNLAQDDSLENFAQDDRVRKFSLG
jgi:hypothetical protein